MKFPNLVYRCPGTHHCRGGTYDYHPVNDDAELSALIKDGWYPTLPFAQDPGGFDLNNWLKQEGIISIDDTRTPDHSLNALSRFDLIAKARELGISFNKKTKDETLKERIADALKNGG